MNNKKIFIALNDYNIPNPIATYGTYLAKRLDRTALFYGVEKVPVLRQPVAITGTGIEEPSMANINLVKVEANKRLSALQMEASKLYPNVTYDLDIGFPESKIIDKAEEESPYVVVLEGNNELTTLHEWFGTYETRLAENIDAPVLVLPSNYSWQPVNRIVYLMELDDGKVENMRFLTDVAEELNANIAVVLLSPERNDLEIERYNNIIRTMRNFLGYKNVNFHQIFTQDSANTVDMLMNEVQANWLAFEHNSKSFLERMLNSYNSKRIILQSEIPVLVF
ncbi:MAG: hypothetical protein AAF573_00380 [Bacteroidota bacterium]